MDGTRGLSVPCVGETHFGISGFVICMKFVFDYEIWKQSKKRQVKLLNALMISCSFVNHREEDAESKRVLTRNANPALLRKHHEKATYN
jgi:hypothetical protein